MFERVEVHKIDTDLDWIEVSATDKEHDAPAVIRLVVNDGKQMAHVFLQRYMTKRERPFTVADSHTRQLEEFFEEGCMAKVFAKQPTGSNDLVALLPTNTLDFIHPERASFRKSRAARVRMFLEDSERFLQRRRFEKTLHRLGWVHSLDPNNEEAFELKIICLRSWKKMAECVPVFETWIAAHPKRLEPRLGLSEMWLYLEQNQRAKDAFQELLAISPNHALGLIGLAQAKTKLGEDGANELRKAWVLDPALTIDAVEGAFDFRRLAADDLEPRSLADIARHFRIPLKRVMARARKGVLPMHPPAGDGLMRFSDKDLCCHDRILRMLGLEIGGEPAAAGVEAQTPLFNTDELPAGEPTDADVAPTAETEPNTVGGQPPRRRAAPAMADGGPEQPSLFADEDLT